MEVVSCSRFTTPLNRPTTSNCPQQAAIARCSGVRWVVSKPTDGPAMLAWDMRQPARKPARPARVAGWVGSQKQARVSGDCRAKPPGGGDPAGTTLHLVVHQAGWRPP